MRLSLALVWSLLGPPADDEVAREAAAVADYREDRLQAAAEMFEALWRDYGAAKYLHNAALARVGLGHEAHAIAHWQQMLAIEGVPETERALAESKLRKAMARAVPVNVRISPPELREGAILRVHRKGGEPRPLDLAAGPRPIHLEPGTWTVEVRPGPKQPGKFRPARASLEIEAGQIGAVVELAPSEFLAALTVEVRPRRARPRATLALHRDDTTTPAASHPVQRPVPVRLGKWAYTLTAPGYAARSGRLELVSPSPTKLAVRLRRQRTAEEQQLLKARIAAVGLGVVGVGAAIAGGVLLASAGGACPERRCSDDADAMRWMKDTVHASAGTGLLGASGGLALGAIAGAVRTPRAVWWTGFGVGAAMLAGGAAAFAVTPTGYWVDNLATNANPYLVLNDRADMLAQRQPIGAVLTGIGAGLAVSAVVGLVSHRKLFKKRGEERLSRRTISFAGTSLRATF